MKLIDNDALVAEIERLRRVRPSDSLQPTEENNLDWLAGKAFCIASLKVFLDTLEVKEVDLEKVFNDEYLKFSNDTDAGDYAFPIDLADFKDFAKHFFELGMAVDNKAQKGE